MAPGEMSAYWSQVFLCAGLHQACLRNHSGPVKDLKFGKNEQIYEYFGVIIFFGGSELRGKEGVTRI